MNPLVQSCFFEETHEILRFVTLPLGSFSLEISPNCAKPIGNLKAKIQDPWKFHIIFS